MLYQPSSLPCDKLFVVCEFNILFNGGLYKFYGKLARVVYEMIRLRLRSLVDELLQRQLRAVLESGADLNLMLPYRFGRLCDEGEL